MKRYNTAKISRILYSAFHTIHFEHQAIFRYHHHLPCCYPLTETYLVIPLEAH